MKLNDIIVVLSRPAEAGNVGALCRAMKNMGLSRLRLAAPELGEDIGPDLSEAGYSYGGTNAVIKARAVHAMDVWEKAETFNTLAEAVKDCSIIIGTTRRRGRDRKGVSMTPRESAAFLKDLPGPAALVFGNERSGLDEDEIKLCNIASHIPVDETFPSLNLSHAVQIYSYELFQTLAQAGEKTVKGQWVPLDSEAMEAFVYKITGSLKKIGFYKKVEEDEQAAFFRDIFSRAGITEREGSYFADIIAKAAHMALKKGNG